MQAHFKIVVGHLATAMEIVAVVIITCAVIEAVCNLLAWLVRHRWSGREEVRRVRLQLGQWLVVSLEFLLAGDIVLTAINPTWDELGKLATIIVLRTILNYFVQRELESVAPDARRDQPRI